MAWSCENKMSRKYRKAPHLKAGTFNVIFKKIKTQKLNIYFRQYYFARKSAFSSPFYFFYEVLNFSYKKREMLILHLKTFGE